MATSDRGLLRGVVVTPFSAGAENELLSGCHSCLCSNQGRGVDAQLIAEMLMS
jgi:hypothetical protein